MSLMSVSDAISIIITTAISLIFCLMLLAVVAEGVIRMFGKTKTNKR